MGSDFLEGSGFLAELMEAHAGSAGLAAAAAGLTAIPTEAGGKEQTGSVSGVPGLSYTTRSDDLSVALQRTDANGQAQTIGSLTKGADNEVYDQDNVRVGQIQADGTLTLDHAATEAETGTDSACRAPVADSPTTRNADLPEALQSNFRTARLTAYANDPQLQAAGLKPFGATASDCAEWRAHHLIPIAQIRDFKDVFEAAAQNNSSDGKGWSADEANNPTTPPRRIG